MPSVGGFELVIVLVVILLLFGSTRLPKLARSIGQASKEFRAGVAEGAKDDDEEIERSDRDREGRSKS